MIHLQAHHTHGSGPHASIQLTHENQIFIISVSKKELQIFLAIFKTGSKSLQESKALVESCFGSHPICNTLFHDKAKTAEIFETDRVKSAGIMEGKLATSHPSVGVMIGSQGAEIIQELDHQLQGAPMISHSQEDNKWRSRGEY